MVRQPAVEVISYLKKADYSKPALRYLFCILQSTNIPIPLDPEHSRRRRPYHGFQMG